MKLDDAGKLVLRASLGLLMLVHGIGLARGAIAFVQRAVEGAGLPSFVAQGAYIGEIAAPVLLVIGWWTRTAALLVALNMAFAVGLVHLARLWALSPTGGWAIELEAMYFFAALATAALGPGRVSVDALVPVR